MTAKLPEFHPALLSRVTVRQNEGDLPWSGFIWGERKLFFPIGPQVERVPSPVSYQTQSGEKTRRVVTSESTWSYSRLVPQNSTSHLECLPTAHPFPGSSRWHSTRLRKPMLEFGWFKCGGDQKLKDSSEEESE